MLCKFSQVYIENRLQCARNHGIDVVDDYLSVLIPYYSIVAHHGFVLKFSKDFGLDPTDLDGSPGLYSPFWRRKWTKIYITPEWAVRVIIRHDQATHNAFLFTLGHEIAHKETEVCDMLCFGYCWRLIATLNEIRADFRSAELIANSNRQAFIDSCEYKNNVKKENGQISKDSPNHISWQKRIDLATNFDFNDELILHVASYLGYNLNNKLRIIAIRRIMKAYSNRHICLCPPPYKIIDKS